MKGKEPGVFKGVFFLAIALSVSVGCDAPNLHGGEEAMEEVVSSAEREHYYSPYYLMGEGDLAFQTISFTDVGMAEPAAGPVDGFLLETIAESLAYKLIEHEELSFTPVVKYDPALAEPSSHLFCEEHHLYIALWRGYEPERWGYSLWSGCEAHHEFAWEEVPDPVEEGEKDLLERVEPLTASIVTEIEKAHRSSCYTSHC